MPRHFRAFAELALKHYAFLFRFLAEASGLAPEGRLRTRLAGLAELRRREQGTSGPIDVTVSQADLATMVGVSRKTLNTLLAHLQARGLIEVGFRRIRVLDEARLRADREPDGSRPASPPAHIAPQPKRPAGRSPPRRTSATAA
jgi:DNA-binding transcriptional MocR family regulator